MSRMSGKVAIITGSSGGIGNATALEFAEEGADLILQYRSQEAKARELASRVEALGRRAVLARVNFEDIKQSPYQVRRMVEDALDQFGKVDVLVNLAGHPTGGTWNKRFNELTCSDFFNPLYTDLFGSFLCARAVSRHMYERKQGVILNVSSTPALSGHNRGFAFTVAKAAVLGLTKALASELRPYIRVNTVALGNVETVWVSELTESELKVASEENLLRRFGKPDEIAKTIAFLCSDDSSFVNGQTIVLDGGGVLH